MTVSECSQMVLELENEIRSLCLNRNISALDKQEKLISLITVRDSLKNSLINLLRRENQALYIKLKKVA